MSRRYALAEDGAYLEFLGHRQGDGGGRHARRVQRFGGLVAQSLARVDVLLHQPWVTRVEDGDGSIDVQVVNPVSFVAQKLLVLPKRHRSSKKANDHVTAASMSASLERGLARLLPSARFGAA